MNWARSAILGTLLAVSLTGAGIAGPIADFETAMSAAYADYRTALFRTNQKDKAGTEAALAGFETKWRALTAQWGANPPPHLSEDSALKGTLDRVADIAKVAKAEAAAGSLEKAHETLEAIRDEIAGIRQRSGIVTFSDHMNAYHEKMEEVLLREDKSLEPPALARLREQAAVLDYLVATISSRAPAKLKTEQAFVDALAALKKSVSEFLSATRANDPVAVKATIEGLKGPYSRMFLKFG